MQQKCENMAQEKSIEQIPIDELTFDVANPRIPKSLNGSDEESVLEWMINKENVIELMYSIGEKGFFQGEPLLVIQDKTIGKYISVEGNRRYTATYLLQYPDKAPVRKTTINEIAINAQYRPQRIPAVVFDTREDIIDYLGYRHITGIEPWDALAKARYLSILYNRIDTDIPPYEKYKALARQIGSNAPYVRQILLGGKLVEIIESKNYFDIQGLDDKSFEFGSFYTGIVRPNIAKYIGVDIDADEPLEHLNIDHLCDLVKWMFEKNNENQTRLGESRNLTKLNKILDPKYENALEIFKKGASLTSAAELTDEADEIIKKKLDESLKAIEIAWSYFPLLKDYKSIDQDQIRQINKTAIAFYKSLIAKINSESDLEEVE